MKVLVADKFEMSGLEGLEAAGCEVIYEPDLADASLASAIASSGADVLVVRSTNVTEAMLDAGRLALVVRAGAGVNTIDVAAASRRGIYVSTCPGKNSIAVAELAFGLVLSLDRRIPDNVAELRAGRWNKNEYSKARGLHGRTLGLIGFGSIGQEMARRALAFGMHVVVWSPRFLRDGQAAVQALPEDLDVTVLNSPEEVAERSDVLSVHLALTPDTTQLVGAGIFNRLKPGTYVVNTARGEVVDHAALAEAVRTRGLRVALDVFEHEPPGGTGQFNDPIVLLPGVYGTHHIGASTAQAQDAIAAEAVRVIRTYAQYRQRAKRREPGEVDARDAQAGRTSPRSTGCARACLRAPAQRQPQRAGDGERDLRGGRRRRGAHQPRREPSRRAAAGDRARQCGRPELAHNRYRLRTSGSGRRGFFPQPVARGP